MYVGWDEEAERAREMEEDRQIQAAELDRQHKAAQAAVHARLQARREARRAAADAKWARWSSVMGGWRSLTESAMPELAFAN